MNDIQYKELHQKAKKKVQAKTAFYVCAIVFFFISILLLMLGAYMPSIAFWLKLPIPIFLMVLSIFYLFVFGPTGVVYEDWQADEIEKEMIKLYLQKKAKMPPLEELSEKELLELKELERIKKSSDREEDYV